VHITRELSSRDEEERRERERERERKEEGEREKFRYRCASRYFTTGLRYLYIYAALSCTECGLKLHRYFTTGLRYCASRLRYSEMLEALSY
jgi:hypothetical protein